MKRILIITSAIVLVAVSVLGTIAYMTARHTVSNTFTIGDVSIALDEAKVTPDGKEVQGAERVTENIYHIIPGTTYKKDPTVTVNKGSDAAYVRMIVTVNKYAAVSSLFGDLFTVPNFFSGMDDTKWIRVGTQTVNTQTDTATYEFRYYQTVSAPDSNVVLSPLFTAFTIDGALNTAEVKRLEGLKIAVEAHAIQKEGFETADYAWRAFDSQMN